MSFSFSVSQLCYLYVCSIISPQRLQIRSTPPEDHSRREAHSTLAYTTLCHLEREREAQERQEGTDEVEQGAEEEINRLKETLAATSHEMEQIKEDYADRADKLQYAEQLLEKAKADFRDKNSRIKALEAHLMIQETRSAA